MVNSVAAAAELMAKPLDKRSAPATASIDFRNIRSFLYRWSC
jgi:hypothetical protein